MKNCCFFLLLALLLMLPAGCGYSLAGRTTSLIQGRTLYPALFANRTYQPNVEAVFRKALLDELALRGENIGQENSADLILSGELESGVIAITAYSAADRAVLNSITLTAVLQLAERQSGRVIWKATETSKQEYPANADLALQRNSRDAAIEALCVRIAKNSIQKMAQAF